jgi:pyruvate/2-oxoglutarate dehydrogenase complex dihydrolipoamide dehydrogenase (E3) component
MAGTQQYDAIVIGSGQGGTPLSKALARAGRRTALVERQHVGGTCVNVGCTPTKTMIASARVAYLARRGPGYGVRTGSVAVDMNRVRQRKRDIVQSFNSGSIRGVQRTQNLDLVMGEARFIGPKTVEVTPADGGSCALGAELIFINTGLRPRVPPIPGLPDVRFLDSTSIMELDQVPEHLLIIGGGYIAIEFGQMFRRFGSRVTIVHRGPRLLGREDPDVADEVRKILQEDGVDIILEGDVRRVEQISGGGIRLTVRTPRNREPLTLDGSHVLVAVGRTPNTDRLNLAAAGVETDAGGFVTVNERLETGVPGIYCIGDAKGGPAFTHISYDDFRIVETNLLKGGSTTTADRFVPYTVFMDPELGRVGFTETEARARGREIRVYKNPMSHVARALEMDEVRGFMKVVVDAGTGQILGCAILGILGGELMSMVELAMMGRLPCTALRDATFAHPTLAEALNNLFDQ